MLDQDVVLVRNFEDVFYWQLGALWISTQDRLIGHLIFWIFFFLYCWLRVYATWIFVSLFSGLKNSIIYRDGSFKKSVDYVVYEVWELVLWSVEVLVPFFKARLLSKGILPYYITLISKYFWINLNFRVTLYMSAFMSYIILNFSFKLLFNESTRIDGMVGYFEKLLLRFHPETVKEIWILRNAYFEREDWITWKKGKYTDTERAVWDTFFLQRGLGRFSSSPSFQALLKGFENFTDTSRLSAHEISAHYEDYGDSDLEGFSAHEAKKFKELEFQLGCCIKGNWRKDYLAEKFERHICPEIYFKNRYPIEYEWHNARIKELYNLFFKEIIGPVDYTPLCNYSLWAHDYLRESPGAQRTEIILSITQWHWWWWYWFCFFFGIYAWQISKLHQSHNVRSRVVPYTSLRSHAKFGDFIACYIPIWWVISIIEHSNALLRIVEWQTISTAFNIRVRGRQWYWVYYYHFKGYYGLLTIPRQMGETAWVNKGFGATHNYSNYVRAINSSAFDFNEADEYWKKALFSDVLLEQHSVDSFSEVEAFNDSKEFIALEYLEERAFNPVKFSKFKSVIDVGNNEDYNNKTLYGLFKLRKKKFYSTYITVDTIADNISLLTEGTESSFLDYLTNKDMLASTQSNVSSKSDMRQYDPFAEPTLGKYSESQVEAQKLLKITLDLVDSKMRYDISFLPNQRILSEVWENRSLTLKRQERLKTSRFNTDSILNSYNKVNYIDSFKLGKKVFFDNKCESVDSVKMGYKSKSCNKKYLIINNVYDEECYLTELQKSMKVAKSSRYIESKAVTTRLLKVINTFVLPTHTPLNVITNSYDVIHSWFIPALGIKFDCVPGKTTTHMLYIEDEGYYYGQCAEVCGRYHHHMPVRLYACNFSEFIVWWSEIGVFNATCNVVFDEFDITTGRDWHANNLNREPGFWKKEFIKGEADKEHTDLVYDTKYIW